MASKTQVANRWLMKLGQGRTSNIETDSSPAAIAVNQVWDTVRDAVLQQYPWNFAIKRVNLPADVTAPSWGWGSAFSLPSDCLQLLEIKDNVPYEIEGGKILCDQADILYIRYIAKITDVALWPPVFVEVFAHEGAIETCVRITDDNALLQLLTVQKNDIVNSALATDSVENLPADVVEDEWLVARL